MSEGNGRSERPSAVAADTGQGAPETAPPADQPWLRFEIGGVRAVEHAAAPTLAFRLDVEERSGRDVFTAALTVQIQIEPAKRSHDEADRARLVELFGERWGSTAQRMHWTTESVLLPTFSGRASLELEVLCNYDLELAATKYFHSVEGGEVPLSFHFNGSVYYPDQDGRLQIVQVPWDTVADYAMEVATWKRMIDSYYPNRGWIAVERETLEALRGERARRGLPTFDHTLRELLEESSDG
jgi:Family of unknown function (DUF6084)